MRSTSTVLSLAFLLLASSAALAESLSLPRSPRISSSRRVAPPEAAHRHSSTAYEGALRGVAAWTAAYGDYLQDESEAAYVWKHVESMHYDNQLKKTMTALTKKRLLAEYREYERQQRRNRQEAAKQLLQEKYHELAVTYRLDEREFNWENGAIQWPATVAGPQYAQHRQRLASLMYRVFRYNVTDSPYYRDQIAKACIAFRDQLREDAAQDHPSKRGEYLAMQGFLLGLKYSPYLLNQSSTGELLTQN